MRVVLDTNTIVQAVLSTKGVSGELIQFWRRGHFELLLSEEILLEYERVLQYEHIRAISPSFSAKGAQLIAQISQAAELVRPVERFQVVEQDPDDNKFIECAVAGGADYLVSSDRALLEVGTFQDVQIVSRQYFRDILPE
jgi:putative PIN family toxin of toxin-antitoxin system